jgi:hypothetical protein
MSDPSPERSPRRTPCCNRQEEGYWSHQRRSVREKGAVPREYIRRPLARPFSFVPARCILISPHPLAHSRSRNSAWRRPRWRALGRGIVQHPTRLYASAPDLSITPTIRLLPSLSPTSPTSSPLLSPGKWFTADGVRVQKASARSRSTRHLQVRARGQAALLARGRRGGCTVSSDDAYANSQVSCPDRNGPKNACGGGVARGTLAAARFQRVKPASLQQALDRRRTLTRGDHLRQNSAQRPV